jgi:hypothetical protein
MWGGRGMGGGYTYIYIYIFTHTHTHIHKYIHIYRYVGNNTDEESADNVERVEKWVREWLTACAVKDLNAALIEP